MQNSVGKYVFANNQPEIAGLFAEIADGRDGMAAMLGDPDEMPRIALAWESDDAGEFVDEVRSLVDLVLEHGGALRSEDADLRCEIRFAYAPASAMGMFRQLVFRGDGSVEMFSESLAGDGTDSPSAAVFEQLHRLA